MRRLLFLPAPVETVTVILEQSEPSACGRRRRRQWWRGTRVGNLVTGRPVVWSSFRAERGDSVCGRRSDGGGGRGWRLFEPPSTRRRVNGSVVVAAVTYRYCSTADSPRPQGSPAKSRQRRRRCRQERRSTPSNGADATRELPRELAAGRWTQWWRGRIRSRRARRSRGPSCCRRRRGRHCGAGWIMGAVGRDESRPRGTRIMNNTRRGRRSPRFARRDHPSRGRDSLPGQRDGDRWIEIDRRAYRSPILERGHRGSRRWHDSADRRGDDPRNPDPGTACTSMARHPSICGVASRERRFAGVVDSYVSDCHALGFDAQAVWGWNGNGPYKITNNYLEATTESSASVARIRASRTWYRRTS